MRWTAALWGLWLALFGVQSDFMGLPAAVFNLVMWIKWLSYEILVLLQGFRGMGKHILLLRVMGGRTNSNGGVGSTLSLVHASLFAWQCVLIGFEEQQKQEDIGFWFPPCLLSRLHPTVLVWHSCQHGYTRPRFWYWLI